jgi:xanthine dehydrogenase YagR molybdenum-binding subunit
VSAPALGVVGAALDRLEGREKVAGQALYAYEYPVEGVAYCAPIQSTIARGEVCAVDAAGALRLAGVVAVLTHENAPRLRPSDDGDLQVLQSARVAYRGQYVAAVVAETLEVAREAAGHVRIEYAAEAHDVELSAEHPKLYKPGHVNPSHPTDTVAGDPDGALADAAVQVDATYTTPAEHNNPMEPHSTLAVWEGDGVTLYDSNQGVAPVRNAVAALFGLAAERVRIISPHVGGGFGSKGLPHPPTILAVLAAQATGRPVKLATTRQQMFAVAGYRTPTIQRMRLGADADGRLAALVHDAIEQTSTLREFAEQTAICSRMMYAAPHRRTTHRLAALDVPVPSWMRAPGECPGMFALESAMDELAIACGVDPIQLRVRNEPEIDPESGLPFSSRNLVACLREGAARFGWKERDPTPGVRRDGRWLVGTGVAASTYPARRRAAQAFARELEDGSYLVGIAAADIGTGARTVLTQIAADALEVGVERVRMEIGDSLLPPAGLAGGSMGTTSWGAAVIAACRSLRDSGEREAFVDTSEDVQAMERLARHAFGAQFVEARVDVDSGEVRIPRALGVFACGRILNPKTARSQLVGGMTMGISMALHEESVLDREFGDYLNHDFAQYHVASCADIVDLDATWVDEDDRDVSPMGAKGLGEIGIVGTAAAVANAVWHATGIRVRDLPIRLDRLLGV